MVLKGSIVPQLYNQLPSITLELAIKQVVINVSTDVLNQILILQTAFIRVSFIVNCNYFAKGN